MDKTRCKITFRSRDPRCCCKPVGHDDLMDGEWAEFVIRFDGGRFVTGTACCPGAEMVCCKAVGR
ncbi:MAG: hypothetical protein ACK4S4_00570 [Pyrinomonadaceae bacterium]